MQSLKHSDSVVKKVNKRGRPPLPRAPYDGPNVSLTTEALRHLPVEALNLNDETLQIRVSSRPDASLVDSVKNLGIQVPLIVRPHPDRPDEYQIVCGFRRATAATIVGLESVPAIVRNLNDEQAQVVAYIENENRKTLGDLDRARAMSKMRRSGKTTAEIASLFRLSDRQVQRVEGLLNYPQELQDAIAQNDRISTTCALILWQAKKKYGDTFSLSMWIDIAAKSDNIEDLRKKIANNFAKSRTSNQLLHQNGHRITLRLKEIKTASHSQKEELFRELQSLLEYAP